MRFNFKQFVDCKTKCLNLFTDDFVICRTLKTCSDRKTMKFSIYQVQNIMVFLPS